MAIAVNIGPCAHGVVNAVCVRCTLGDGLSQTIVMEGDTIWFSGALLRQIADEPKPLRVSEIYTDIDGSKILRLERG